ncbi:MAG: hypothetical protein COB17_03360 [Sulfurimonas sp.]|nr:MAG: hypothetical protein COB17_03360 [Sulfurimonas sp.]
MNKFLLTIILPSLLLAHEFNGDVENEISWLKEETYVISASRVKENIKKTPVSITVIDKDTIQNMGANNFLDILRLVPGMGVSQSNVYVDKIESRGIKIWFSEKVLIMLDGHSLNIDLLNGGTTGAYKYFPVEIIQRIEIMKGPASALYGENAFSAVINIITKKSAEIDGTIASIKYGSDNTKTINLLYGKKYEDFELTTNINYRDTNGDSRYIESDVVGNSGYTNPYARSLYAYLFLKHNNGFYIKGNINSIKDGPKLGIVYALNDEDHSHRKAYFLELGYEKKIDDMYSLLARVYDDEYIVENRWELYPEGFPSPIFADGLVAQTNYKTKKTGSEILLTIKEKNFTVVSGISYEIQELNNPTYDANYNPITGAPLTKMQNFSAANTNFISEVERSFYAAYSELLYDVNDALRFNIGFRYDYYTDFGKSLNPRFGAALAINENNNIKIMYSEAFRAPTFAELYNKNNPAILGNPDLSPEKIRTIELNIDNESIKNLRLSLSLYKSEIEDVILIENGQHQNLAKINAYGLEAQVKYDLKRGSYILANYTYKDSENKDTGQDLEDIANNEGYLALNYRINKYFNFYLDANYIGSQTRSITDTRAKVRSSVISNLTLISKNFILNNATARISVYNIFDEKTYDSSSTVDYPIASRSYMAELSYRF